jgi:hypothetical protein
VKTTALALAALLATASAAEKPAPEKKASETALPEKGGKEDPLSLENLLNPGQLGPEILPAPEALPEPPSTSGEKKRPSATSARAALLAAANDYRRKTELFRKGKISRDALRNSAIQVAQTAKTYRASLR